MASADAVSYTYDSLSRVATRNGTGFTYTGLWLDPTTDGVNTYGRSPAGRVVAHDDGSVASLVGLDRHGDVTWLADPTTGVLSDSRVYDPFGEVAAVTGVSGITVGFQGDYTDPATDEVWMGARWYDPIGAQFRSRDTVFGELMTPVSLNRYTYGFANLLVFRDPDGRFAQKGPLIDGEFASAGAAAKQKTVNVRGKKLRQARARINRLTNERPTYRATSSSTEGEYAVNQALGRGVLSQGCNGSVLGGAFCPDGPDGFVTASSASRSSGGSSYGCSVVVLPEFCNQPTPFNGDTIGPAPFTGPIIGARQTTEPTDPGPSLSSYGELSLCFGYCLSFGLQNQRDTSLPDISIGFGGFGTPGLAVNVGARSAFPDEISTSRLGTTLSAGGSYVIRPAPGTPFGIGTYVEGGTRSGASLGDLARGKGYWGGTGGTLGTVGVQGGPQYTVSLNTLAGNAKGAIGGFASAVVEVGGGFLRDRWPVVWP